MRTWAPPADFRGVEMREQKPGLWSILWLLLLLLMMMTVLCSQQKELHQRDIWDSRSHWCETIIWEVNRSCLQGSCTVSLLYFQPQNEHRECNVLLDCSLSSHHEIQTINLLQRGVRIPAVLLQLFLFLLLPRNVFVSVDHSSLEEDHRRSLTSEQRYFCDSVWSSYSNHSKAICQPWQDQNLVLQQIHTVKVAQKRLWSVFTHCCINAFTQQLNL